MLSPLSPHYPRSIILLLMGLSSSSAFASNELIQNRLEKIFSVSIALTDSDAISIGFVDFDPNSFINLNDSGFGSDKTIDTRSQVSVGSIPYSSVIKTDDPDFDLIWSVRGSYALSEQDIEISSDVTPDRRVNPNEDSVLGLYGFFGGQNHLNQHWSIAYGLGTHLLYYRNKYEYNNSYSQAFQSQLDGYALNTSAWALIGEPSVKLKYLKKQEWGSWNVSSRVRYFYGTGWGEANDGDIGNPEGMRFINELEFRQNVALDAWSLNNPQIHYNLTRIDVAGDLTAPLDTHYYYEFGAGLVFDVPYDSYFFDNFGIGINFNYGSSLSGGSLLFLLNN
ncbi:Solitary outer membrane autotransporter beta-barrel domain [Vibrio splendidus]|uniref:Solitary outer membrane autotransporter beta-barrel domain n=1 Tax=Vibrio splendidus TaxID=29497 RepID=A0AA43FW51_VIBSP|nr:Solitary outer membrane autotransporter beta-barrel domain [Vibrio splendidus]MDH5920757.1 Solitary outer membrane autotransporter beta-barrel domain [Vibrio splendidus]